MPAIAKNENEIPFAQAPPSFNPREGLRLFTAGAYFVAVVTRNRECFFGEIVDGEMKLDESFMQNGYARGRRRTSPHIHLRRLKTDGNQARNPLCGFPA